VAFPLRAGRPALRAGTLEQISGELTNLASRFAAERTDPSVSHLLKWPGNFVGYEFNRPDSVAPDPAAWLPHPESSGALPMTWLLVGVYRKANTKWSP